MSTSVLYDRLRDLVDAGLVARTETGDYTLTSIGGQLGDALAPLDAWANRWAELAPPDQA